MKAILYFHNGKSEIIENLTHINKISTSNSNVTKISDFDSFVVYHQPYVFVGSNRKVTVNGAEVQYVSFEG